MERNHLDRSLFTSATSFACFRMASGIIAERWRRSPEAAAGRGRTAAGVAAVAAPPSPSGRLPSPSPAATVATYLQRPMTAETVEFAVAIG